MKAIVITAMLLIGSISSAQGFETQAQPAATRWTCDATGRQAFNFPGGGGGMWQSVTGYGSTQTEAAGSAINRCYSIGLRECRVGGCFKNL